ncbi:hypothetical protein F5883DRAFT_98947 [Diaporthe sp. PMI_573]|jgi:hypothetical protein|nr:hypothetical protein F5883DRAFT_98947 [Diaporthaceae sp. PMI_573]
MAATHQYHSALRASYNSQSARARPQVRHQLRLRCSEGCPSYRAFGSHRPAPSHRRLPRLLLLPCISLFLGTTCIQGLPMPYELGLSRTALFLLGFTPRPDRISRLGGPYTCISLFTRATLVSCWIRLGRPRSRTACTVVGQWTLWRRQSLLI